MSTSSCHTFLSTLHLWGELHEFHAAIRLAGQILFGDLKRHDLVEGPMMSDDSSTGRLATTTVPLSMATALACSDGSRNKSLDTKARTCNCPTFEEAADDAPGSLIEQHDESEEGQVHVPGFYGLRKRGKGKR
ncbi:hypothetical protein PF007_g30730 [Phytophthora fragariae]|uniref:Uncharacterized protein n=2 Tax=Phytophthora fragariae TaxID=53985 RepID=A0A6A3PGR3_9STRA|nr:hypothetical protein PF003_g40433 [Phytophthora fragariae]KAE9060074.1 hypothetical protein PF007_g30730 [Phytophthora fragariae]